MDGKVNDTERHTPHAHLSSALLALHTDMVPLVESASGTKTAVEKVFFRSTIISGLQLVLTVMFAPSG